MHLEFNADEVKEVQKAILDALANRILDKAILESERQHIFAEGTYEKGWEKRVNGQKETYIRNTRGYGKILKDWIESGGEGDLIGSMSKGSFMGEKMIAEVGNTAPFARWIEWGAGVAIGHSPFMPPFDPIHKWVEKKKGESGDEAIKSTWKIINHIKMKGLKPHYVLTRAVTNTVNELSEV